MPQTKTKDDSFKFAAMVAEKQGWKLNPDAEFLDIIIEGLTKNNNRYGYFSCPCRLASGSKNSDRDIICPCAYSRPDILEYGHCYCGLYLSENFFSSGRVPSSIKERRPY
ncbi:MAG: ferredoxin:thioredoxin reductase [Spirochaetes bacterium]|jgi:ferredoxin-thioredoxin reductase catalytic subunit|nr:ferredoxin:thioredoxin reductase [Spirochaetota bacterium]